MCLKFALNKGLYRPDIDLSSTFCYRQLNVIDRQLIVSDARIPHIGVLVQTSERLGNNIQHACSKPPKSLTLISRLETWKQVMLANRALMQLIPRAVDSTDYRSINQFHRLGEECLSHRLQMMQRRASRQPLTLLSPKSTSQLET